MSFDAHKNLVQSTVALAPSPAASGLSLNVATGDGALFPQAPFNVTVYPADEDASLDNAEVLRVSDITGDTLTIARAQEGSSARTIVAGDRIALTITARTFTDIEAAIEVVSDAVSVVSVATANADSHANAVSARVASVSAELVSLVQIVSAAATSADAHADVVSAAVDVVSNALSAAAILRQDVSVTLGSAGFDIKVNPAAVVPGLLAFNVFNAGFGHELLVIRTEQTAADLVSLASVAGGQFDETGYDVRVDTGSLAHLVSARANVVLEAGHYVLVCNEPGHTHLGMALDWTVQDLVSIHDRVSTLSTGLVVVSALASTADAHASAASAAAIANDASVSAAIMVDVASHLASTSVALKADLTSVSAVIKADIASVSAAVMADAASHLASASAAIIADVASHLASTSVVLKADLTSVSAVIKADIASVSAAIKTDTTSAINVLSNLASNWVSAAFNASTATSSPAISNAASNAASANTALSATIKADAVSADTALSTVIKADIASVSAAIKTDAASMDTALSTVIKTDIASVSAAIVNVSSRTTIGGATSTRGLQSAINNLSNNDSVTKSAYAGASTTGSIAALSLAILNDASVSAVIKADALSADRVMSTSIKADAASMDTALSAVIWAVSAKNAAGASVKGIQSALNNLSNAIVSGALAASTGVSIAALSNAISNDASVSAAIFTAAGIPQFKAVTGAQAVTSTWPQKVSGMSLSIAANAVYNIHGHVIWTVSGAASASAVMQFGMSINQPPTQAVFQLTGNKHAFSASAAVTSLNVMWSGVGAVCATPSIMYSTRVSVASGTLVNATMLFDGVLVAGGTGGLLKCLIGASTTSNMGINVIAGSYIRAFKVG